MSLGKPPSDADVQEIRELDPQSFALWKNNPITLAFMRYLGHLADSYRIRFLEEWEAGISLSDTDAKRRELEQRGRILMLEDLTALELAAIRKSYGVDEEADARKNDRPGTQAD